MLDRFIKYSFVTFLLGIFNQGALAISGEDISNKISSWLLSEGIKGKPVFSKKRIFEECDSDIKITKPFQSYSTVRVQCVEDSPLSIFVRVKLEKNSKENSKNISTVSKKTTSKKIVKNRLKNDSEKKHFKVFVLKTGLEKNTVLKKDDILTKITNKRSQISFFTRKDEIVGRKLKKNLKMGQLLHPRHLYEKFDINEGDFISIVTKVGNASVTASGEARDFGNMNDLIRVKNLKSGKIIKGYIKKNKIIKVYR